MRQDYLTTEVGWREALRLGGLDLRELHAIGWRGWAWIAAVLAVGWAWMWITC